jgi:hypothetical protein
MVEIAKSVPFPKGDVGTLGDPILTVQKHAPGQHDQKTHGGKGGGGGVSWSKENNFKLNYTENTEIYGIYDETFDVNTYDPTDTGNNDVVNAVTNYTENGYKEMNDLARGRGLDPSIDQRYVEGSIANLDKAIDDCPQIIGDKNLYRVYSDRVLEKLEVGDVVVDKGFLSTTRIDITGSDLTSRNARERLGSITDSADTMAVILPSPNETGKGLIVDMWLPANGISSAGTIVERELEVILPRNTSLTFLGYQGSFQEKVAIFQRND